MADSLQDRVARLVMGGAHALIDKVEGLAPEATMAQAIREIDEVLGEVRVELGRIEATKHQLATRLAKLAGEHEDLGEKAESGGPRKSRRPRRGLPRTADADRRPAPRARTKPADPARTRPRNACEGYMRALIARKQEREQLLNEYIHSPADPGILRDRPLPVARNIAWIVRKVRSTAPWRATGVLGYAGDPGDAIKLKEIADLQRRKRIDERLGALKKNMTEKP